MDSSIIKVHLDETVKENTFFHRITSIDINKTLLFKYAIMMFEAPSHIVESDFDHLQSKVPYLEGLIQDYIELDSKNVFNLSTDDRIKKIISEAVGVGIGLKYATDLLVTNPNKFKKIGRPDKGKYLDYSTIKDRKKYEIETKGTVSKSYTTMKKDILSKKHSQNENIYLRFGTITLLKNKGDKIASKCVVVDDPPTNSSIQSDDTFKTQLESYAGFLSHLIDPIYYKKYIQPLQDMELSRIKINKDKFFGKYIFRNKVYYGEFFDHRLIKDNIYNLKTEDDGINHLFKKLTHSVGIKKIFIGIDADVLNLINAGDKLSLEKYVSEIIYQKNNGLTKLLDKDGILIVKSLNNQDEQINKVFTEEEVKIRLSRYYSYIRKDPHTCGAPCRSRELEGKPCDIVTYNKHCHFHR